MQMTWLWWRMTNRSYRRHWMSGTGCLPDSPFSIEHHPGYFFPLPPSDAYLIADISPWTSLTREQWPEVFEGCHCRQFSINNLYCGFWIICGARQVFCLCSADLLPMPLKHNYPCFQVFLHFLASHSTQHQVVREHHHPGWTLLYVFC